MSCKTKQPSDSDDVDQFAQIVLFAEALEQNVEKVRAGGRKVDDV
jgi:hypothetical protein